MYWLLVLGVQSSVPAYKCSASAPARQGLECLCNFAKDNGSFLLHVLFHGNSNVDVALRKLLCEPWHGGSAAEEAAKQRGPTQQDARGKAAAPTPMEVDLPRSDAAQVIFQLSSHGYV